MNQAVLDGLNKQLNKEFESAYVYLALSSYFEERDLDGFAEWLKIKAKEEMFHAMKIYNYLGDRRAKRTLTPISMKSTTWKSPLAAMEAAYKHECSVTESIHDILALARQHKDYQTEVILHWFVNEQIEEEAVADKMVQKVKMVEKSPDGMFMLDNYMAAQAAKEAAAEAEEE
jgi:ferritin